MARRVDDRRTIRRSSRIYIVFRTRIAKRYKLNRSLFTNYKLTAVHLKNQDVGFLSDGLKAIFEVESHLNPFRSLSKKPNLFLQGASMQENLYIFIIRGSTSEKGELYLLSLLFAES